MERLLGPLPENAFVVAARDSIPQPKVRVTTASSRGNLVRRGRGRSSAPRESATSCTQTAAQGTSSRGRKKHSKITKFSAPRPTRTQDETFIPDLNDAFILQEDAQEVLVSQSAPAPNEEM